MLTPLRTARIKLGASTMRCPRFIEMTRRMGGHLFAELPQFSKTLPGLIPQAIERLDPTANLVTGEHAPEHLSNVQPLCCIVPESAHTYHTFSGTLSLLPKSNARRRTPRRCLRACCRSRNAICLRSSHVRRSGPIILVSFVNNAVTSVPEDGSLRRRLVKTLSARHDQHGRQAREWRHFCLVRGFDEEFGNRPINYVVRFIVGALARQVEPSLVGGELIRCESVSPSLRSNWTAQPCLTQPRAFSALSTPF